MKFRFFQPGLITRNASDITASLTVGQPCDHTCAFFLQNGAMGTHTDPTAVDPSNPELFLRLRVTE